MRKKFKLREEGSEVLYQECEDVTLIEMGSEGFKQQAIDMLEFMRDNGGVGLSAPQVGISKNFFVMGMDETEFVCINPKVVNASDDVVSGNEGCLSFPGLFLKIDRPNTITVTFKDLSGELQYQEFAGIWARIFLHELDHLQGKVFTHYVSNAKLSRARSKAKKVMKYINQETA